MYVLTNVAAMGFLARRGARVELVLPAAGIAVAGYVLYHHVWPVPDSPYDAFPYIVVAWLVVGVGLALWRKR
jgi:predicted membrane channel-forming protein YqfA (hemolysin III family)